MAPLIKGTAKKLKKRKRGTEREGMEQLTREG